MEKEVIVIIDGMQYMEQEHTSVSVISFGNYYYKGGRHYVTYDEAVSEGEAPVKNLLKIGEGENGPKVELIKTGRVGTHFVFEEDKNNITCYETEFGSFMLGLHSKSICVKQEEDEINIEIEYAMEVNYEHVSDNKIEMNIKSKSRAGSLKLGEEKYD